MPRNQGIEIMLKTDNGYTPLHPEMPPDRIIGKVVGERYGPYTLSLTSANWANGKQTLELSNITEMDIPIVIKQLEGTKEEMIAQNLAYSLLDPIIGVESKNGSIIFTLTDSAKVPSVDFNVQVYWFK